MGSTAHDCVRDDVSDCVRDDGNRVDMKVPHKDCSGAIDKVYHDFMRSMHGGNVLPEKLLDIDFTKDLHPPLHVNPLSGSTTSPNPLLEDLADELALITFPSKYDDDLQFDIESDLKEIEFLLHQDIDSSLKDSIDQSNLADNFVNSMPEMFTDEHALDYSHPSNDLALLRLHGLKGHSTFNSFGPSVQRLYSILD
nr:hypothetical protein [Tanacetum cinerariifolium]